MSLGPRSALDSGRRAAGPAARAVLAACLAAGILWSLLAPRPADARRLFVPKEHRTIQAAIDAASPGDTVWVGAGVYPGGIRITKSLVLFGDAGQDSTILDGGDSVRVVHVEGVKGGHLLGFTVRRGKAPGGGGIYCLRDTSFNISSCKIEKNWESGIAAWQTSGFGVIDNVFRENEGSGLALHASIAFIRTDQFFGNRAPSGGGIWLEDSQLVGGTHDCLFQDNRAEAGSGGAVFADSSAFSIDASTFRGNQASVAGGAVSAMGGSQATVGHSLFSRNSAPSGAAIHSDQALVNIGFSIFDRNHSIAAAAAVQVIGRGIANVNPLITDNTFFKNSSDGEGAAIYCQLVSPEIRKNIFVVEGSVKAVLGPDSAPLFDCNLIYDPTGAALGSLPSANTLVGDPRLCDPEQGDFRVRDLSPAYLAACGPVGALKKPCTSFKMLPAR